MDELKAKHEKAVEELKAAWVSFEETQRIQKAAALHIDSSWHYSWHWPRTHTGYLTHEGWKKALADGRGLLEEYERRSENIRHVLADIERVLLELELRDVVESIENEMDAAGVD